MLWVDRIAASVHCDAGEYDEAIERVRATLRTRDQARVQGITEAELGIILGTAHAARGELDQAAEALREAIALIPHEPHPRIAGMIGLAEAYGRLGRSDEAFDLVETALAGAVEREYGLLIGRAHTARGELHLALGRTVEALSDLNRGLAIQRETGYRLGQAQTLTLLARIEPAHAAEAGRIYTDMGAALPAELRDRADLQDEHAAE
jgi:tetratricopeptide (TPR) repeat protein